MRRIHVLLAAFASLCAVLALSSSANAQSVTLGQLKSVSTSGNAVTALPTGVPAVRPDNDADFRQHWDRELVSTSVFRFSRQGFFNACLRVPDTAKSTDFTAIAIGSCSGTRAQWRRTPAPGTGDYYVNVATAQVMAPDLCIFTCQDGLVAWPGPTSTYDSATPLMNWTFQAL
jgi:hypothetical protein